jgi:uncharacterized membrane protein (DUF106 family)
LQAALDEKMEQLQAEFSKMFAEQPKQMMAQFQVPYLVGLSSFVIFWERHWKK